MKFLGPRESSAEKLQITSVTFYGFQRKSLLDVSLFTDVNCATVKNNQLHNINDINWSIIKCRKGYSVYCENTLLLIACLNVG